MAVPEPVGVADVLLTDLVDGGNRIAAHVEFAWYPPGGACPVPMSALELWTFDGGRCKRSVPSIGTRQP
jgi:hypothetical protein